MFIDSRQLPDQTTIETDVCIIGAGAAGISMALELENSSLRVCVLESGGFKSEKDTMSLYEGENVGRYYELNKTRARFFGGSTNWWGGFCRPLDRDDFEECEWIPNSGWPITLDDLDPYYDRASEKCGVKPKLFDLADWAGSSEHMKSGALFPNHAEIKTDVAQMAREYKVFGTAYRNHISVSTSISVYLYANVRSIETTENGNAVTELPVQCLDGKEFSVRSKIYILAAGGIENARLMLLSNRDRQYSLGNEHDLVGRYFMEHPLLHLGDMRSSTKNPAYDFYDSIFAFRKLPVSVCLSLRRKFREEQKILKLKTYISPIFKGQQARGSEMFVDAYHRLRRPYLAKNQELSVKDLIADAPQIATSVAGHYLRPHWMRELFHVSAIIETCPNPDSRVSLSDETDRLGLNRVKLDWQLTDLDTRTLSAARKLLSEAFRETGETDGIVESLGEGSLWHHARAWVWHHMGTTRMHQDPRKGVVDANCQVHGVDNLFIAGSSVFPTCGNDQPTLTIVALAIRLADSIKARFYQQAVAAE